MEMRIIRGLTLMVLLAPLFGCAGNYVAVDQSKVSTQNLPSNYRQIIAQHIRSKLFDPYSVREAAISAPKWGVMGPHLGERLFVCVRFNSKNRLGGYVGTKFYTFGWIDGPKYFYGDFYFWEDPALCPNIPVTPFPELGNPN